MTEDSYPGFGLRRLRPTWARGEMRLIFRVWFQAFWHCSHEQPGPPASTGRARSPPISWNNVATIFAGRREDICNLREWVLESLTFEWAISCYRQPLVAGATPTKSAMAE